MLWPAGDSRTREAIAKAIAEHNAFENEHRARMEKLLAVPSWTCAKEKYRTVNIDADNWFIRPHGSYDMDQKAERIVGEVTRMLYQQNRRAPRDLRSMVEAAL